MRFSKHSIYIVAIIAVHFFITSLNCAFAQNRNRHRHGRDDRLQIVCSFSDYASIANYIVGDYGHADYIAAGEQDPHFVPPKPSFAMKLRNADMWITTGMDLEVWSTTLLDKAHNKTIMDGEIGFVSASADVNILEKPLKADRSEGDIHLMGNPHITTSPLNWKQIARNITIGLRKIDPDHSDYYIQRQNEFIDKVDRAMFGNALVDMFGGETLQKLLENNTLFTFLDKEYEGGKLVDQLGGWLKKALPFRGYNIICYHKNWSYFTQAFGLNVLGFIEPKPGIPPSAKHVQDMIELIKDQHISVMIVASYFEKKTAQMIEAKTGVKAVFLPLYVNGVPEAADVFSLADYWIDQINKTIKRTPDSEAALTE
ncbi:zinc ABC transporter substrate-binding protein [candidate division KSB1 bacterium]|nr:zinc ABC transporter substrate-binding protein [candidate division KSB1 bacterium]